MKREGREEGREEGGRERREGEGLPGTCHAALARLIAVANASDVVTTCDGLGGSQAPTVLPGV